MDTLRRSSRLFCIVYNTRVLSVCPLPSFGVFLFHCTIYTVEDTLDVIVKGSEVIPYSYRVILTYLSIDVHYRTPTLPHLPIYSIAKVTPTCIHIHVPHRGMSCCVQVLRTPPSCSQGCPSASWNRSLAEQILDACLHTGTKGTVQGLLIRTQERLAVRL